MEQVTGDLVAGELMYRLRCSDVSRSWVPLFAVAGRRRFSGMRAAIAGQDLQPARTDITGTDGAPFFVRAAKVLLTTYSAIAADATKLS
jgi:hypothetical protein